eukprot:5273400-Lingulodinium_polyedra.AAC.1
MDALDAAAFVWSSDSEAGKSAIAGVLLLAATSRPRRELRLAASQPSPTRCEIAPGGRGV